MTNNPLVLILLCVTFFLLVLSLLPSLPRRFYKYAYTRPVAISMESLLYEDIPDAAVRLRRMKLALSAFVAVRATTPTVTAILVRVALAKGAGRVKETLAVTQLHRACSDRVELRKWLKCELGVAMDLWIVAAVEPCDIAELSCLSSWQSDRYRSPLRQADALSISLRETVLLLGGTHPQRRRKAPVLTQFVLTHQSLLIDLTCCFYNGSLPLVDPVVFSFIRAKHVAKGRTAVVLSYSGWLPLTATSQGLASLQQKFQVLFKNVISPMQIPLCCAYGGEVEALQHNLVTLSLSESLRPRVSAALLATRSLKDIFCLVGVLLSHPEVNYYGEAMAFCLSVQRRRRAAGLVYQTISLKMAKAVGMAEAEEVVGMKEKKGKRKRSATRSSSASERRGRDSGGVASSGCGENQNLDEPPLWYEDVVK